MPSHYRCQYRNDINTCLNNCPHKDKGECIDGMPIPKKVDTKKQAKKIIAKKYKRTKEQETERARKHRIWFEQNKDKCYEQQKEYRSEHKELIQFIARKSARLNALKEGKPKISGVARIKGKDIIIYKGKKKDTYWYLFGKDYFETDENEMRWCWIEKVV